ncbi:hypothetical protein KAR91_25515 [Candidatus Pacearchaeota archaeon]|nr:hypothetical protein [Candidatus Pacearchaeota archaeon]
MILTFAEDFSSTVSLDSELLGTPESGLYWNRGVHPVLTVNNLLAMLPVTEFTFSVWDNGVTYNEFETSRKRSDVVTKDSVIYLSLTDSNTGNDPDGDTTNWQITNIESLRIRSFIWAAEDNFTSALSLNRKLIENQYIYNEGRTLQTLSNDFSGWAFEPKGSDYVKIRINQMALQANTTDQITVSVINQGTLITTLTLNPNNGILSFEDVGYTLTGKGRVLFVFPSQEVKSENAFNDPLRYDGFVCYPVNGIGASAAAAEYSENSAGNGLGFNVSAYLDSSVYLTNNKINLAKFLQTQFEYDFIRMVVHNSNTRSNRDQRIINQDERALNLLATESLNVDMNTVARKYLHELKMAVADINKTFDKFLHAPKGFKVKRRVS